MTRVVAFREVSLSTSDVVCAGSRSTFFSHSFVTLCVLWLLAAAAAAAGVERGRRWFSFYASPFVSVP